MEKIEVELADVQQLIKKIDDLESALVLQANINASIAGHIQTLHDRVSLLEEPTTQSSIILPEHMRN